VGNRVIRRKGRMKRKDEMEVVGKIGRDNDNHYKQSLS